FHRMAFGFEITAYAGLETGVRDRLSYVLEQGDVRLIFTSAIDPKSPIGEHVRKHGDSVKDIAITVEDAAHAYNEAVKRGARPVQEPTVFIGSEGHLVKASVGVNGDTVHSFIERNEFKGTFLPNHISCKFQPPFMSMGFTKIDHIALSVEREELDQWVDFYK